MNPEYIVGSALVTEPGRLTRSGRPRGCRLWVSPLRSVITVSRAGAMTTVPPCLPITTRTVRSPEPVDHIGESVLHVRERRMVSSGPS